MRALGRKKTMYFLLPKSNARADLKQIKKHSGWASAADNCVMTFAIFGHSQQCVCRHRVKYTNLKLNDHFYFDFSPRRVHY